MNIHEIMKRVVETCSIQDSLEVAAAKMWECDIGILPVLNHEGHVVGMITDRDICMATYTQHKSPAEIPVTTAMSKEVFFTEPEATIQEAEMTMRDHQVRRLPVIDAEGRLVGIVSLNDLAREAEREVEHRPQQINAQEVMTTLAAVCAPRLAEVPML
jgi:CBS domain-containing protein